MPLAERLQLIAKHQLVGGLEAEMLVEGPACFGCVERDHAYVAAAGLFHGAIEQSAAEVLASELRVNVEVEKAAADGSGVLEGGREIDEQKAGTGYNVLVIEAKPAEIFVVLELSRDPRLEILDDGVKEGVIGAAHVDEHAVALVGEDLGILGGDRADGEHASF
jgi:hypothetical protein